MFYGLNEKFLTVKNKSFKYVEKGNGKLVLLVHGWPENWTSWYNQISFISELGFKVVAFNTRGFVGSQERYWFSKTKTMISMGYKYAKNVILEFLFAKGLSKWN